MTLDPETLCKAQRHLARRDPVLQAIIKHVGPCSLSPDPDRFGSLVRAIISQQISTLAARAIHGRLVAALAEVKPAAVLAAPDETLRAAGLSQNKMKSLRDLADKVRTAAVPLDDLHDLADEEAITRLVAVRGIGRWTAEMFLIFSLGRLDVLPVDDFGLCAAVRKNYRLRQPPKKARLQKLTEPWTPYRSIGTWYMWKSSGWVPRSGE